MYVRRVEYVSDSTLATLSESGMFFTSFPSSLSCCSMASPSPPSPSFMLEDPGVLFFIFTSHMLFCQGRVVLKLPDNLPIETSLNIAEVGKQYRAGTTYIIDY